MYETSCGTRGTKLRNRDTIASRNVIAEFYCTRKLKLSMVTIVSTCNLFKRELNVSQQVQLLRPRKGIHATCLLVFVTCTSGTEFKECLQLHD